MMAVGKKELEEQHTDSQDIKRMLRDDAEEQLTHSPKRSSGMDGQTPEQLLHELEVHQIELEIQAEELRMAHIAVVESRDKYLDLYEFAPVSYFTLTDKALIEEVNLAGATLLGTDRKKLVNARFRKFIAQTDSEKWTKYFMDVLDQEDKQTCTLMLKRSDGSMFPAWLESNRITSSDAAPTVRITVSDITDIKKAEEALGESEEKYRQLIENSHDIIYTLTAEGVFIFVSPAWTTLLGHPVTQVTGQSFQKFVHPDDIPRCMVWLQKVIWTEQRQTGVEYRVQHSNGTWYWHTSSAVPFKDEVGKVVGFYGIARDITERKLAEDALVESENRFSVFMDYIPVIVFVKDSEGRTLFVNKYMDNAVGASKWMGKTVLDFMPNEFGKKLVADDMTAMKLGYQKIEESIPHLDGKLHYYETQKFIIPRSDKEPLLGGISLDITERKELENEMKYHEQELMEFSTSLATANRKLKLLSSITRHDINNQLTVQMGYLSILEKKEPDTTHNEYFKKVSTAAKRISAMIQFTKEYEEIGVHAPTWQDCRTVLDTAAKQAPLGIVMVKNDLPAGAEVFADPLIVKVFYNLMDNSVRYGRKITTIWFSVEEAGDDQIIVCEDNGDGIPTDEKEKIFERGFGKNTGLGLALSREILDITGISIKETGESGKGARFEMVVPNGAWRMTGNGS